jgi:hypothetical protein
MIMRAMHRKHHWSAGRGCLLFALPVLALSFLALSCGQPFTDPGGETVRIDPTASLGRLGSRDLGILHSLSIRISDPAGIAVFDRTWTSFASASPLTIQLAANRDYLFRLSITNQADAASPPMTWVYTRTINIPARGNLALDITLPGWDDWEKFLTAVGDIGREAGFLPGEGGDPLTGALDDAGVSAAASGAGQSADGTWSWSWNRSGENVLISLRLLRDLALTGSGFTLLKDSTLSLSTLGTGPGSVDWRFSGGDLASVQIEFTGGPAGLSVSKATLNGFDFSAVVAAWALSQAWAFAGPQPTASPAPSPTASPEPSPSPSPEPSPSPSPEPSPSPSPTPNATPGSFALVSPPLETIQAQPVELVWNAAIDPDGDLVAYDVYVDTVSPPVNLVAISQESTSRFVSGLAGGTTHYWQVVAKDGRGGFTPSTTGMFVTAAVPVYAENFETVGSLTELQAAGWRTGEITVNTGVIQIGSDPAAGPRQNVLEIIDGISTMYDPGAVIYSPAVGALLSANLTGAGSIVTVQLDFRLASDISGRWFVLGKTQAQAFVMNDPSTSLDAYSSGGHSYIALSQDQWYTLKLVFNAGVPGYYDIYLYDGTMTEVAGSPILGKPFNAVDNYESLHLLNGNSDGCLMFGSWFSATSIPDTSCGHAYIDNIEVWNGVH